MKIMSVEFKNKIGNYEYDFAIDLEEVIEGEFWVTYYDENTMKTNTKEFVDESKAHTYFAETIIKFNVN